MPNDLATPIDQQVVLKAEATLPGGQLQRQADSYLAMVEAYTIDSPETLQDAADERNKINDRLKEIEEQRKFLKEPMLEQGRRIDSFFRPVTETLTRVVAAFGLKMTAYTNAEQRRLAEEQRLAREKSDREAAEKRALAAKAQAEADAKAEELRKKAEAERAAGNVGQAAKLESRAESAAAAGADKAAALQVQAEQVATAPVAVREAPKAVGVAIHYDHSGEVVNLTEFFLFVANKRPDLIPIFEVSAKKLNQQVRSLGDGMDWPGVKVNKTPRVRDTRR